MCALVCIYIRLQCRDLKMTRFKWPAALCSSASSQAGYGPLCSPSSWREKINIFSSRSALGSSRCQFIWCLRSGENWGTEKMSSQLTKNKSVLLSGPQQSQAPLLCIGIWPRFLESTVHAASSYSHPCFWGCGQAWTHHPCHQERKNSRLSWVSLSPTNAFRIYSSIWIGQGVVQWVI